jgi:hypothetical protein
VVEQFNDVFEVLRWRGASIGQGMLPGSRTSRVLPSAAGLGGATRAYGSIRRRQQAPNQRLIADTSDHHAALAVLTWIPRPRNAGTG